ncbi:hypothetical protein C6495_08455 [Candidatus Poribacteria bacterium]|nr:MAG: hypothetical protein C6495_08455 [Candidatus Poribacteria bacterium]
MASRLFVVRKALDTQFGVSKLFAYPLALRQDRKPLEPPIIISAWIAVDAATFFCCSQGVRYAIWCFQMEILSERFAPGQKASRLSPVHIARWCRT